MSNYDYDDDIEDRDGALEGDGVLLTKKAEVLRIIFQKPGSDFKILKMDDGLTWVGVVGESTGKGSIIEARGYLKPARNPSYPDDFKIEEIINIVSYSKDGLQRWLMDRLPDIGETRAKALVKQFPGETLFEVIENDPEQLTTIRGITSARAVQIQEAYKKYAHELRIVPVLVTYGIPYLLAQKAVKIPAIEAILAEDPFELMSVPKFSFGMLKDFVLKPGNPYGMDQHDPRIIRAFGRQVLMWAEQGDRSLGWPVLVEGGNSAMSRAQMLRQLSAYRSRYSESELMHMICESDHIVCLPMQEGFYLMLQDLALAEENVTHVILQKLALRSGELHVLPFEGTNLDDSQKHAASALVQLPIAVMTGGPGTGKTTTLKAALDAMEANGEIVKLASFTGKAAKRMTETTGRPATTIHKLLEWGPAKDEFGVESFGFRRDEGNPIEADAVVIDEASMVDIRLASSLFSALGPARIVLVGDSDQLPPVGPGQLLTDVMKRRTLPDGRPVHVIPTFRLTNVYRQGADSWVIDNARRIINGEIPSLKNQSDFQFIEAHNNRNPAPEIIRAITQIYEKTLAAGQLNDLQVLAPMKKPGVGASTYEINVEVQKALNPISRSPKSYPNVSGGDNYTIFEGDKVIFTKNNADLGLVNGDMGRVEAIDVPRNVMDTTLLMRVDGMENSGRDDGLYELRGADFQNLLLAYAITIHKSQGSEWKEVVVVMDRAHEIMLKRQLLYTAVTRTSKYLRIVGQRSAVELAARSPRSNMRQTLLFYRIVIGLKKAAGES